ncbi:hypothetical protein SVAN01_07311 [Stagonosporopsis vannaccii]|nr:hypothetical protein SVAN01_07311 [Stagonosporopsis vannaccii]
MAAASDAGSADSFDLAPDSPLTREKTRAAHIAWVKELEQRPEFRLLESLPQHPDAAVEDAIHRLVDLTHASALDDAVGNHCWMTACSVVEMASRTPPEQQRGLIGFVLELSAVVLTDPATEQPWMFDDGAGVVWQDLPTFGYTIADEMGSFDGHEQEYTAEEAEKWENLTAFLAQIDADVRDSPSVLDFSLSWAPTAFTWAFEGGGDQNRASELAVRLACIWLVYDADKLWSKVSDSEVEIHTLDRWNAWRQGLVDGQSHFVNGTTPMLITHALAQMHRVQGSR